MSHNILIIGATSSLGVALCRKLAKQGHALTLSGRDKTQLLSLSQDLHTRFCTDIQIIVADLSTLDIPFELFTSKPYDVVYMVAGDMGTNDKNNYYNIAHVIKVNFTTPAQILTAIAAKMEERKKGSIAIISSVAADRGRQSNYVYGSAKAGLTAFASGLRNRLYKHNVHVMTVKPGFIDTPMTYGMNSPLIADRYNVASQIIKALAKKKNSIYVPFFWRYIMLVIMHIPEQIFKKLTL